MKKRSNSVAVALNPVEKTVLVLDVVESVDQMARDELGFIERWRRFLHWAERTINGLGGELVKTLGDGLRASFPSVPAAVDFSFQAHGWEAADDQNTQRQNAQRPVDWQALRFRIGIHVCEVIRDENDLYGSGVNLAARLSELSRPGDLVVSAQARDALVDELDGTITDLGQCYLRHMPDPVHAYRVNKKDPRVIQLDSAKDHAQSFRPLIAVVPLREHEGESGQTFLGTLIAERLINQIGYKAELDVLPVQSTARLVGRNLGAEDYASLLNASHVLTGSFDCAGSECTCHFDLYESATGIRVWQNDIVLEQTDLLDPEPVGLLNVIESVHQAMLRLANKRVREWPLINIGYHDLLLGAVSIMHRASRAEFNRAGEALRHLVDHHRRNPVPRAWLAQWYVLRVTRGIAPANGQLVGEALEQTDRALDLDDQCALALTMRGMIQCQMLRDLDSAASSCSLATGANPSESLAWLFTGVLHSFDGEGPQAADAAEKALRLSSLHPLRYFYLSLAASAILPTEDYDRVVELARQSARLNQSHSSTFRVMAIACALNNDVESARTAASRLLDLEPAFTVSQFLERAPSAGSRMGPLCAQALREAGVPE